MMKCEKCGNPLIEILTADMMSKREIEYHCFHCKSVYSYDYITDLGRKKMTNREWLNEQIAKMSNTALIKYFPVCSYIKKCREMPDCAECKLQWLEEQHKENEDDEHA